MRSIQRTPAGALARAALLAAGLVTAGVAAGAGGAGATAPFEPAENLVRLTARERAGVSRRPEPVVSGVPLPRGVVRDPAGLTLRDGRAFRGVERDAYGWLAFGDGLHHAWEPGNPDPRNLVWDGNYYDFPRACLLHALLTGRETYFRFFVEHSRHLADVHMVHHDPDPRLVGANRYCPPTDHVRRDPPRGNFRGASVYVSDTFNHHKTQSLFDSYLLTADPRALDAALLGLRFAHDYTAADDAYNQPRGPGAQLLTLAAGYEMTGDRKYLERCRPIVEHGRKAQEAHRGDFNEVPSSRFQFGIAMEGLHAYHQASGDPAPVGMIRTAMEFLMERGLRFANCAHACGFLYSKTGERKYVDYGRQLDGQRPIFGNPVQDTAITFRSAPYFLPYLLPEWARKPD